MNTLVSFELAKMLKLMGFDLPCRFSHKSEKGWEEGIGVDYNWNKFDAYSAPTIAEAVMWVYEKYGAWISISFANKNQWFFNLDKVGFSGKEKKIFLSNYDFNTPTEAYEAPVKHVLNNLK